MAILPAIGRDLQRPLSVDKVHSYPPDILAQVAPWFWASHERRRYDAHTRPDNFLRPAIPMVLHVQDPKALLLVVKIGNPVANKNVFLQPTVLYTVLYGHHRFCTQLI